MNEFSAINLTSCLAYIASESRLDTAYFVDFKVNPVVLRFVFVNIIARKVTSESETLS